MNSFSFDDKQGSLAEFRSGAFRYAGAMAVPLLSKKIVKKRVKKFKRPQSDRKISVKVSGLLLRSELVS